MLSFASSVQIVISLLFIKRNGKLYPWSQAFSPRSWLKLLFCTARLLSVFSVGNAC